MKNMDLIAKQKSLADRIIRDVSALGYDVILAGGAPRDWTFDHPAEDLDIYIEAHEETDTVLALEYAHKLSSDEGGIRKLGDEERYALLERNFEVYEFSVERQFVQFIFTTMDTRKYVKELFNNSLCKIWYDGKDIIPTWEFSVSKEEKVIVDRDFGRTLDKVLEKPWRQEWCRWPDICMDWSRAFRAISGNREGIAHPMPEGIDPLDEMFLDDRQVNMVAAGRIDLDDLVEQAAENI